MDVQATEGGVSMLLQNPSPDSATPSNIVLQVLDLKPVGSTRYTFLVNDGKLKIKAMLPSSMSADVVSGKLQDKGLIRIKDYTCNAVPNQPQKVLIITDCEVVSPALDHEIGAQDSDKANIKAKIEGSAKPSAVLPHKSAAQIIEEQRGKAAPATRLGITRRVSPLVSLNPYQGNWTIKVRVTSKGPLRTYRNARGEGSVFNVELTDEDGTQIQATMFKEAADKFYSKFELGKVYYISKGILRVANRQYSTINNNYEMTLNVSSEVEEIADEQSTQIPITKYNFVKLDELGPFVNGKDLVDILGIVQNVSQTVSVRRKANNEEVPKRDVTVADQSQKTVVVSLWNDFAVKDGEKLLEMLHHAPVVLIKGLRVTDFQGVSLSTTHNSMMIINPDVPDAHALRSWYERDGKEATMTSAGANLPGSASKGGSRSIFADRAFISDITLPEVGEGKPAYFHVRACISFIKPEQPMWYLACSTCNRKVTEEGHASFWCEGCQKRYETCNRRYIMSAKMTDSTGETWISAFNEQAEQLLGHSAEELAKIRSEDNEKLYQVELKQAAWHPQIFRVSVAQTEYMNEKRQRITVRSVYNVDWAAESSYLLEQIARIKSNSS